MNLNVRIHVAADDPQLRHKLGKIIEGFKVGDVVETSTEGAIGVANVKSSDPAIILIATGPGEDVTEHAFWYTNAAPEAHVIGFAFTGDQARAYEETEVDAVVTSKIGRERFIETLREVVQQKGGRRRREGG